MNGGAILAACLAVAALAWFAYIAYPPVPSHPPAMWPTVGHEIRVVVQATKKHHPRSVHHAQHSQAS